MSTFVVDVDGTLCGPPENRDYLTCKPYKFIIDKVNGLYDDGHTIILHTARGMHTYNNDILKIELYVRPVLENWLNKHNVKYHQLIMGKPWGPDVWYIDDRAFRPIEFLTLFSKDN